VNPEEPNFLQPDPRRAEDFQDGLPNEISKKDQAYCHASKLQDSRSQDRVLLFVFILINMDI